MALAISARGYKNLAFGTLVYNLAVVAWGALVRATGSGAGCGSHWPDCNGQVVPTSPTVKTAIEFTHRATSGIDTILAIALLVFAFTRFPRGHGTRRGGVMFMVAMVLEALAGAGLVKLGLVEKDASPLRAVAISIHQVLTLYLLFSLALLVMWSRGEVSELKLRGQGTTGLLAIGVLAGVPLLAISGAIAALGDTLYPTTSLSAGMHADFAASSAVLLKLRVLHPLFAVGVAAFVFASMVGLARRGPRARDAAYTTGVLLLCQLGAGVVNIALLAPTWMQLAHLVLADLTWISLVRTAALALAGPEPEPHGAPALAS
ncbi:MAG: COX15/CtaA family protein [Deltaproteobacteria bacterium]|nr:COX15/CtaA family protein [Deltaproteobacteria bacterium]